MDQRNKPSVGIDKVVIASGGNVYSTKGFTLVEVMVTLTILGLILLILFGAFRLGLSAWERGESLKEELNKRRIISQLISQQIKSIVPYKIKTEKAEGDYFAFQGKTRSLKFVSAFPIKGKRPEGFVYVIYEFKEEGAHLILYEQRVLNRDFFEDKPKEELGVSLLEGISNIRFEYYRNADKEKNATEEWVEEWNAKEEKELPQSLRVVITFKNENGKRKESSLTLLTSIPAHRFDAGGTTPTTFGRAPVLGGIQRQGF